MGSDETAMATTGGPRVIAYLTVTGFYRAQITYFFRGQIGSRARSRIALGSGGRLDRIRRRCGSLVLSESPGKQTLAKAAKAAWAAERNRPKMIEAATHAA